MKEAEETLARICSNHSEANNYQNETPRLGLRRVHRAQAKDFFILMSFWQPSVLASALHGPSKNSGQVT